MLSKVAFMCILGLNHAKIISEKYGCSLNNQSLLLIKHIYCDTLTNFLKLKSVSKLTNGVESYG